MGGEGHMLDMIKKMELNRRQRINARNSFDKKNKPAISTENLKHIPNVKYPPKEKELTPKQKKIYQVIAITVFIVILVALLLMGILFIQK